jgi:hypothetical protein
MKLAKERKEAGDESGALQALKEVKLCRKELDKLDGQELMIEQLKKMIESDALDMEVILAIRRGENLIEQMSKEMNVDDIADLKDEMEERELYALQKNDVHR